MMKCDICGEQCKEADFKVLNMGRITKRLCPKCYKKGRQEVMIYQTDIKNYKRRRKHENEYR